MRQTIQRAVLDTIRPAAAAVSMEVPAWLRREGWREEASGVLTRLAGLLLQWRQSAVTVTQIPSPLVRADQKPG